MLLVLLYPMSKNICFQGTFSMIMSVYSRLLSVSMVLYIHLYSLSFVFKKILMIFFPLTLYNTLLVIAITRPADVAITFSLPLSHFLDKSTIDCM